MIIRIRKKVNDLVLKYKYRLIGKSFIIKIVNWFSFPLKRRVQVKHDQQVKTKINLLDQIENRELYYYNQIELNKKRMETFCNQSIIKFGSSSIDENKLIELKRKLEQNETDLLNKIIILNEIKKIELYTN